MIPTRAARFDLHGVRQQGLRLLGGAVQGPATRAGGGPRACACRAHQDLLYPPHQGYTIGLQGKQSSKSALFAVTEKYVVMP